MNCIVVYLIILIKLSKSLENEGITWSHFYGNPSNTRRIIPSLSTNYIGQSWVYKYMSSAQDIATQGTAVGINEDLYLFVSEDRNNTADYLLCITSNDILRWKIYLERILNTFNSGISNIVSNQNGIIYYLSSWANLTYSTGFLCRIINAESNQAKQECFQNDQFYTSRGNSLSINFNSTFLITATQQLFLTLIDL